MDIRDEFGRVNITNQNFKGRDEVLSAKVLRGANISGYWDALQ
mgnify:FL=1